MQQIINLVIRYKNFLLYLFLLIISLIFTIQSHSFHQSKFFNSSNWISGNVYQASFNVTSYFDLYHENKQLIEENKRLQSRIINSIAKNLIELDSVQLTYTITSGQVIKNSYANSRNYITINKGKNDSIKIDMGVITAKGILGIVENTSKNFANVQSILNTNSNINAKIKNTNHFGSLIWDTKSYNVVQLVDIPRLVPLAVGDTIVTGAMSSIFPENIPVGTIKKFNLDASKSFYNIDISLFNDMTDIKNIYVVHNTNQKEVKQLEASTNEQ